MAIPVVMPRQGQSVESCVITQWFKSKGDLVGEGDLLYAYETDKAAFEAEAPADGILLDIFFQEGDEVPVLTNVAVIGKAGEDYNDLVPGRAKTASPGSERPALDAASRPTSPPNLSGSTVAGSRGDSSEASPDTPQDALPYGSTGERLRISPLAKRIARENRLEYSSIRGTGPGGRIIERDIRSAISQGLQPASTALPEGTQRPVSVPPAPQAPAPARPITTPDFVAGAYTDTKPSNMRKIIAHRMLSSLQSSAQLTHHISADARAMLALRKQVKEQAGQPGATNITINDMVCFAIVKALKKHPEMNAHFLGSMIRTFHKVHLGFAVDTDRGLMVPVLQNADELNLEGLSIRLKQLAAECKQGSINPELLASEAASFTVSNLGAFGIEMFTPVLNIPQVGILGINTITHRPADLGNGTIGFIPVIGLSLTYDHRAVDGAPASRFLKQVKENIENINNE